MAFGAQCVLTVWLVLCLCGAAKNDEEQNYNIDIPQLTVDEALNMLAQQTDVQLLFPFDLVKTLDAKSIVGRYTLMEALELLLQDTGLAGGLTGSGVITISRVAPPDNQEEVMLTQTENKSPSKRRGLLGVLAAVFAISAGAQEEAEKTVDSVLDEILVTAQRREQTVQDVGISITAFSADDINELRIQVPSDLASHIPNVDMTSQLGKQNVVVTIRGVGLNDINANISPSVGVYVDDVFLASPGMLGFSIFDLERIEVLKGPQGTLYGRNTIGGAINFITKKPGDEGEGYLTVGYGNFDATELEGAVTVPISENLSARLAATYDNRNSFFTNVSRGRLGDLETYAFRGILAANLSPNVETSLTFQYGRDDSSEILWNPIYTFGANCNAFETGIPDPANCTDALGFFDPTPDDPFSVDIGDAPDPFLDVETFSGTLRFNWSIAENINLTSITGYQDFDRTFSSEQDSNELHLGEAEMRAIEIEQFSQEFRLAGLTGSLDWISGVFYSFDTIDSRFIFNFSDFLGFITVNTVEPQDTESVAGFVDGRWQINDRFTIVGGARLTYEKRDFVAASGFLNGPVVASTDDSIDETDLSGRIGVEYTPNENSLYYATISNGFHSGGFFGSLTFAPDLLEPFGPEDLFAYEIGGKWTAAEGRLQVNASAFYYQYEDLQTIVRVPFGNKLTNIDGTTDVWGLDLDFTVQPIPGLLLRGAIGLLDTEMPAFDGPLVGPIPEGNELPNAPSFSATGLARYEFPIGAGGLIGALQVDFHYKDDTHREAQNLIIDTAPNFTVVNARASISSPDVRWEFAVWGKNLNDDIHPEQTAFLPFAETAIQVMAAPRTYGATLSYRF